MTAIQIFKHGIKPEWEDEINKKGSEWRLEMGIPSDPNMLQMIWEGLVFDFITGNRCPHIEDIAGARIV